MLKLPEDIESVCLGSGCPNNCWYCHEPKEIKFNEIPDFKKDKVYLYDMNILAYEDLGVNTYELISRLGKTKKYFELSSGVDWRMMDLPIACLLRKYRFGRFNKKNGKWSRYIRFAWDGKQILQYEMVRTKRLFLDAGFKERQIGIFMLVNGKDCDIEECRRKLNTINRWGCQVDDCCYDGGYPTSKEEFNDTKGRFEDKRYWEYEDIVRFRAECRKHNQKVVRDGIDPELKEANTSKGKHEN